MTATATTLKRSVLRVLLDQIDVSERVRVRAIEDAIKDALAETWLRRAAMFDAITGTPPLPLDADPTTVEFASESAQIALACRRHAWLIAQQEASDD
jgi:hypothetical protein